MISNCFVVGKAQGIFTTVEPCRMIRMSRQILSSSPPDAALPSMCFAGQRRGEFHAGWDYGARHSWSPGVQERLVEHNVRGCVCGGWK